MTDKNMYKPALNIIQNSHINEANYEKMYKESITSPDIFWEHHG